MLSKYSKVYSIFPGAPPRDPIIPNLPIPFMKQKPTITAEATVASIASITSVASIAPKSAIAAAIASIAAITS